MSKGLILVFYVAAGGGHKAAANALVEAAKMQGFDAEAVDALSFAPAWFAESYVNTHLISSHYVPSLYGSIFDASNKPDPSRDRFRASMDKVVGRGLIDFVKQRQPTAVICTHFNPLIDLGKMRLAGQLDCPVIATVTDYVAHAFWVAPGVDLYCTAPGRAAHDLQRMGVPKQNIMETGIPIRSCFGELADWQAPAEGKPLQVLVTSGGFGVGPIKNVLRSFYRVDDISLDVVCGNQPKLVEKARRLCARRSLNAVVSGFVTDMPERMARAHVVVGKPGGLTMSECLAAGRPMIVVGACPGQETENLKALQQWGAGVSTKPKRVGNLVSTLFRWNAFGRMAQAARSRSCPQSAHHIIQLLEQQARRAALPTFYIFPHRLLDLKIFGIVSRYHSLPNART
jgi:processive 1,2-diacylglycerol beta-glucosyltransferase